MRALAPIGDTNHQPISKMRLAVGLGLVATGFFANRVVSNVIGRVVGSAVLLSGVALTIYELVRSKAPTNANGQATAVRPTASNPLTQPATRPSANLSPASSAIDSNDPFDRLMAAGNPQSERKRFHNAVVYCCSELLPDRWIGHYHDGHVMKHLQNAHRYLAGRKKKGSGEVVNGEAANRFAKALCKKGGAKENPQVVATWIRQQLTATPLFNCKNEELAHLIANVYLVKHNLQPVRR